MKIPIWQLRQDHHEEVSALLKQENCLDSKGQLRSWKKNTWAKLKEIGHSSLDFEKCSCKNL